jgi:hypothetical protein
MSEQLFKFDPVSYSNPECEFLLEHLGQPAIVALRDVKPPVNPKAVRPILERVNELDQLQQHEQITWVGTEALKDRIRIWLRENAKWSREHQIKRAPRWPSLLSFDAKGRGRRGGPGSDSNHIRTYFGPAGERIPFEIWFYPETQEAWQTPHTDDAPSSKGIALDADKTRIECLVCGHTEVYKAESRSSYAAARARMSKHLRKATDKQDEHRETYVEEFGA